MTESIDFESEDVEITDEEKRRTYGDNFPKYGSKEWQDYVLSQLKDDEVEGENRYPKCSGLRRVGSEILGNVIYNGPVNVFPAVGDANIAPRAAVHYQLQIDWILDRGEWVAESNLSSYSPDIRTFADAADCDMNNTEAKYAVHAAATASTRAEGRCWRKALCLNIMTAEEMANDNEPESVVRNYKTSVESEVDENKDITSSQIMFIEKMCKKYDIDPIKLINMNFDTPKFSSIKELDFSTASNKSKLLSDYQHNKKEIPENIKK